MNEYKLYNGKYSRGIKFSEIGKGAAFDKFAASKTQVIILDVIDFVSQFLTFEVKEYANIDIYRVSRK